MILDEFKLDGKVGIVTGASRGLGQAMAVALAQAGADIAGVGWSTPLDDTQERVRATGRRFLSVQADLTDTAAARSIPQQVVAGLGRIDILVSNAGTIRRAPAVEFSEQDWDDVINVNLKSLFFLCQEAAKVFLAQGSGGKIINIASLLSFQGGILVTAYTASKSGVAGLTKLLANEWARHGINVNAIAPGYMATDNTAPLRNDPKRNAAILERIPAGAWGEPSDLDGMVVYLASDASRYCHGAIFNVDGGWLGR
ncbi:MAG: 2-dehydro-3-deoxy-D-gluconate 5-dehydrogenase KduD [bacterium]|nr:2-dehydro-3-deoxy-D-gluconate 5-dehydrogenase KduD [bacterium]